jgi:hypothetical protein
MADWCVDLLDALRQSGLAFAERYAMRIAWDAETQQTFTIKILPEKA